jgi:hypothetical protein
VVSAFLASEMCELGPRSKSLTRECTEGKKGRERRKLNFLLPSSFLHSVAACWTLPTRSVAKNGGGYYRRLLKQCYSGMISLMAFTLSYKAVELRNKGVRDILILCSFQS